MWLTTSKTRSTQTLPEQEGEGWSTSHMSKYFKALVPDQASIQRKPQPRNSCTCMWTCQSVPLISVHTHMLSYPSGPGVHIGGVVSPRDVWTENSGCLEYPIHDLEGGVQVPGGHILLAWWRHLCRKEPGRAGPAWAL